MAELDAHLFREILAVVAAERPIDPPPAVVHEWRITGQPDGGYPPYQFTYRSSDQRWPGDIAEQTARSFVDRRASDWPSVSLAHRTITFAEWTTEVQHG